MRAVLLRENAQIFEVVDIEDKLEVLRELVGCHTIDITWRLIGDKHYNIVCNDEGLLQGLTVTALDPGHMNVIAGNILIVGDEDDEGALTSLTDEDVENIRANTFNVPVRGSNILLLSISY